MQPHFFVWRFLRKHVMLFLCHLFFFLMLFGSCWCFNLQLKRFVNPCVCLYVVCIWKCLFVPESIYLMSSCECNSILTRSSPLCNIISSGVLCDIGVESGLVQWPTILTAGGLHQSCEVWLWDVKSRKPHHWWFCLIHLQISVKLFNLGYYVT